MTPLTSVSYLEEKKWDIIVHSKGLTVTNWVTEQQQCIKSWATVNPTPVL